MRPWLRRRRRNRRPQRKDEALEALTDGMRADLRYAENTVNFDDDQLKLIGWGGRKARTSLEAPGQARTLEAPRQGDGWVFAGARIPSRTFAPSGLERAGGRREGRGLQD